MNTILLLNEISQRFVTFAWSMLLQSSSLILLLLILNLALRKRVRAVVRYCLWLLVLIKLVLPTNLAVPTGLGYWLEGPLASFNGGGAIMTFERSTTLPDKSSSSPIAPLPQSAQSYAMAQTTPATVSAGSAKANAAAPSPVTWQAVVFLVWCAGIIVMTVLMLQRYGFVHDLIAQARPADDKSREILADCCRRMSMARSPELRLSPALVSPAVCGLVRPVILIPEFLSAKLSAREMQAVLLHELAHIRRGDLWINLIQTILQIAYFYNPLLWLANWIIRRVREQAVDETVLVALRENAEEYPETLLSVAKFALARPALALRMIGVVESKSALTGRIRHILAHPIPATARLGTLGTIGVFALAATLLPMAKSDGRTSGSTVARTAKSVSAASSQNNSGADAFTYLVTFKARGSFHPASGRELLNAFNERHPSGVRTHHFSTRTEGNVIIGRINVDTKVGRDAIVAMLERSERLQLVEVQPIALPAAYIVSFKGKGTFRPRTAEELFSAFNGTVSHEVSSHHFRTRSEGGTLIGYIAVNGKDGRDKATAAIEGSRTLTLLSARPATGQGLEALNEMHQESLADDQTGAAHSTGHATIAFPIEPARVTARTVYPGKGIELIQVGDGPDKVKRLFGQPEEEATNPDHSRWLAYRKTYGIEFFIDKDSNRIGEIRFNPGYRGRLADGNGLGDSLEKVLNGTGASYSNVKRRYTEPGNYTLADGLCLTINHTDKGLAYKFENSSKGVLYWFDNGERMTQFVVFPVPERFKPGGAASSKSAPSSQPATRPQTLNSSATPPAIEVHSVNKRVSVYSNNDDFSTPESAYAAINRVMASGDNSGWARVSVARLSSAFQNDKTKDHVDADWAKAILNAEILEVRRWDDRAVVIARFPEVFSRGPVQSRIDMRWVSLENGKWLNNGEDCFETIEEARAKFARGLRLLQQEQQEVRDLAQFDAQIRKYPVNKSVTDLPEQDFSTPEAAYAAINRVSAAGDTAGWVRVSVRELANRLKGEDSRGKMDVPAEWAKVLHNARILEVRVWRDRSAVMAELPQKYSSQPIRKPIDVRHLTLENGRWLNTGNDRVDSIEEGEVIFNRVVRRAADSRHNRTFDVQP